MSTNRNQQAAEAVIHRLATLLNKLPPKDAPVEVLLSPETAAIEAEIDSILRPFVEQAATIYIEGRCTTHELLTELNPAVHLLDRAYTLRRQWAERATTTTTSTTSLERVLMRRDNLPLSEVREMIAEARQEIAEGLADPEEVLLQDFGLEPDYIFDLLEG